MGRFRFVGAVRGHLKSAVAMSLGANDAESPWTVREATFQGAILERGFWLYVWEVTTPEGKQVYYVGRTGDNSSTNAQSPYNRLGQHLGFAENTNALRKYLVRAGLDR
jgi:hypothetical protein